MVIKSMNKYKRDKYINCIKIYELFDTIFFQ